LSKQPPPPPPPLSDEENDPLGELYERGLIGGKASEDGGAAFSKLGFSGGK
jgi:hypothetical protein